MARASSSIIPILKGSSGLNTNVDPAHLPFDRILPLISCFNTTIEDTGRISRVLGKTKVSSTVPHSFHVPHGCNYALCVVGSNLSKYESGTFKTVNSLVNSSNWLSYSTIHDGKDTITFFSNGIDRGKVVNGTYVAWSKGDYVGPTITKTLYGPFSGQVLCLHKGRMFIAQGQHVFYSLPNNLSIFEPIFGRMSFQSRVRLMVSTNDTLWVSDEEALYTVSGSFIPNQPDIVQTKVTTYPAYEGIPTQISVDQLPFEGLSGIGYLCLTPKGICLLSQSGLFRNFTERKLELRDNQLKPLPVKRYFAYTIHNKSYFSIEFSENIEDTSIPSYTGDETVTRIRTITTNTVLTLSDLDYTYLVNSTNNITITIPSVDVTEISKKFKFIKKNTGYVYINIGSGDIVMSAYQSSTSAIHIKEETTTIGSWTELQVIDTGTWFAESDGNWEFSA